MPPSEGGPHGSNSNIRVFVNWQDQVVFAGEEVRCTITFKNVAPVPGTGNGTGPSTPGFLHPSAGTGSRSGPFGSLGGLLSPSPSRHAFSRQPGGGGNSGGGGERRNKANAVGLAPPPPSARGHRSSLSLSTSAASRSRSGSIPWSPPPPESPNPSSGRNGHGHKRSVSIVSIGSSTSTIDALGQNGSNGASSGGGNSKNQRPGGGRGHARASSLQIMPRASPLNGPRSGESAQEMLGPIHVC